MPWHAVVQPSGTPSVTCQHGLSSMLCADTAVSKKQGCLHTNAVSKCRFKKRSSLQTQTIFCAYGSGHQTVSTSYENTDSDSITAATSNVQVWDITQVLLTAWTVHHCQEQAGFCQWLVCLARPWKHQKLAPMGTCQAATWLFRQWCKHVVLLPAFDHCTGMHNSRKAFEHIISNQQGYIS